MRKTLALFFAAVLTMSMASCSGGNENTSDSGDSSTQSAAPSGTMENDSGLLVVGEPYSTSAFDITITGFDFTEQAENPNGDGDLVPGDGYVTANVYYTVKFTGKAQTSGTLFQPAVLNYGDGYHFNLTNYWFYKESSNGWLNSGDVQPLAPEFPCKACFFVPEEVMTEKENALSISFLNSEPELVYSPRPEDENAKETTYQYCTGLIQSDSWNEVAMARSLMAELGEYKDSADLMMEWRLQYFTYEDREFFKEYVADLEPMSGDGSETLLTDATYSSRNNYGGDGDGTHTITFNGDGTVNANYTSEGQEYSMYEVWRMEDGSGVCTHSYTNTYGEQKTAEHYFTPYQYDETRYLLIDQNGDYSMVLTQQ